MRAEFPITVAVLVVVAGFVLIFVFSNVFPAIKEQSKDLLSLQGGDRGVKLQALIRQCDVWLKVDFLDTLLPLELQKGFTGLGLNNEAFKRTGPSSMAICANFTDYDGCLAKCAALLTLNDACAARMSNCFSDALSRCQLEGCS